MVISELIKKLQEKDQSEEVEFIVIKSDGELLTAYVTAKHAKSIISFMKRFK